MRRLEINYRFWDLGQELGKVSLFRKIVVIILIERSF